MEDEENWTPKIKILFNEFYETAKNELLPEMKLDFSLEDIQDARIRNKQLNPFFMSKIVTDIKLIADFKLYLLDILERLSETQITWKNSDELKQTIEFAFDKLVDYEKIDSGKIRTYNYDITSWLDSPEKLPLEDFHLLEPIEYIFKLDAYILSALKKVQNYTNDLTTSVYRLRTNEMGPTGDKIFCYRRYTKQTQSTASEISYNEVENIRMSKREASRRHIEIAERSI